VDEVGTIISLGDGNRPASTGLDKVMAGELLQFGHGVSGLAMNLEEDQVGAVLLGASSQKSKKADEVKGAPGPLCLFRRAKGHDWPRGERAGPAD